MINHISLSSARENSKIKCCIKSVCGINDSTSLKMIPNRGDGERTNNLLDNLADNDKRNSLTELVAIIFPMR